MNGVRCKMAKKINKKIYIVTCGNYSNYRIVGVFSNRKKAKRAVSLCSDDFDKAIIEVWILNKELPFPKDMLPWEVRMDKQGNLLSIGNINYEYFKESTSFGNNNTVVNFKIIAKDEDHAIKIANEKRVHLIVNEKNDWPESIATPFN